MMKLFECPVRTTADVIDGKWKPMIINELKTKPLRFGHLLRALPEASRKVVTEHLRELEREQIVSRKALGSRPDVVEYSLTNYGRTLVPVLDVMAEWGSKHRRRTVTKSTERSAGLSEKSPQMGPSVPLDRALPESE
jgi:DNA-binding HxlR family transcriptional regulator